MKIFKSSIITTLIAGLLLSAVPLQDAFAQRGGGNRGGGGGGGRSAGGGGGGNRGGGGGGQRSVSGGPSRSGGRGEMNRGPSGGPSRSDFNRNFSQGQRGGGQVNRGDGQRSREGSRTGDGNRDGRSFSERNFEGDRSRTSNYRGDNVVRGDRDGNRNNNFDRDSRNRNDFDRGRYSDFNRGNYNRNNWNSNFFGPRGAFGNSYLGGGGFGNYGNYGRGWGYGGWNGYGGYGLGYGRYGGYGFLPFLSGLGLGYGLGGYGLGYGGYGLGYGGFGPAYGGYYSPSYTQTVPQTVTSDAEQPAPPADASPAGGTNFAALGESEFRAGNYQAAMMAFRHALVDEPNNAGLMLLIAQCLFQTGQWSEAAGATELAMGGLPEDKWGTVVENYTQLYGNIEDYTRQLKELENAVKQDPNSPALRFLVGYHFGYLGYPKQAVRELGKAVELESRDPAARRLHDIFAAKTGAPTVGPVPQSDSPATTSGSPTSQAAPPAQVGTDS